MPDGVELLGLRDLSASFAKLGADARKVLQTELKTVAAPVQRAAETETRQNISNIGPRWGLMRIGITRRSAYIAPKERSRKSRQNRRLRRPNLAGLLMDSMEQALQQQTPTVERAVDRALDRLTRDWESG